MGCGAAPQVSRAVSTLVVAVGSAAVWLFIFAGAGCAAPACHHQCLSVPAPAKARHLCLQKVCCGRLRSAARLPGAAFCAGTPSVQTVAHRSHAAAIASIPAGRVQRFAAYSAHVLPSAGRVSMRSNVKPSFPSKLSERWLSGATIATTRFRPALALA